MTKSFADYVEKPDRNSPPTDEKAPVSTQSAELDEDFSDEERQHLERKLLRKLDLKLIPWLCLLYLVSFLDRTNIGNAKIAGLQKDLHITNGQYDAALCIFFVSYSVFEPASNILLKRLRPSIYIPCIMTLWGIFTICQGLVHNFAGLAAVRWFLGMAEAGLFPGCNYYLSCWYKRTEFGVRSAIFFSAAALAGSFGGLLAAAIGKMDGVGGKAGWAWIFILEGMNLAIHHPEEETAANFDLTSGIATVLIGIASFWMVHDFPDEATFLSHKERTLVHQRLSNDKQSSADHEDFEWKHLWASIQDFKTYTSSLIYMGCGGGLYAVSLFLPTIIVELGYKTTQAQLLTVPPFAAAAVLTVIVGFIGDKSRQRGLCAMIVSPLAMVGFAMLLGSRSPHVKLAATFLVAMGIYPCIPNTIAWVANNTEGSYKRGATLGIAMGWANLQGVVISNVYSGADAPNFIKGHAVVLGYIALCLFGGSALHYVLLRVENGRRRAGVRDGWVEGKSQSEIKLLGDRRPDFMYML